MPKPFPARPATAFDPPAGSAGAAHFAGDASMVRAARTAALRARAEAAARADARPAARPAARPPDAAPRRAPGPPEGAAPRAWPRPPSCLTAAQLHLPPEKARVAVAGLVIVRQRPGSAKGVLFITLEDETGVVNVVVWTRVYAAHRRAVMAGRLLRVTGRIQRDGTVVHVVADVIEDLSVLLDSLAQGGPRLTQESLAHADEVRRPNERGSRPAAGGAPARAQGLIAASAAGSASGSAPAPALPRRAAPRAMHPRDQAKLLFRDPPGVD